MSFILIQSTTVDGMLEMPSCQKCDTADIARDNMKQMFQEALDDATDGLTPDEISDFKADCEIAMGNWDGHFSYENHEYMWSICEV